MVDIHMRVNFEDSYERTPPWEIGAAQPAVQALADAGEVRGRVLDSGCGTGEHAMMAAMLGLDAVGVDSSPSAIRIARERNAARGLAVDFVVGDVLDLAAYGPGDFDTIIDTGVFHLFDGAERVAYVTSLAGALRPAGRYIMLCFSDLEPGDQGPYRITRAELEAAFTSGWRIDDVARTMFRLSVPPDAHAWLARIARVG
jgi:SAM-dependent methyltransferase